MHYILMVKGKLNNMNDYIRALNTNRYKGADMKKDNESRVVQAIYEQFGRLRITRKVRMHYRWYEPDKRRDLSKVYPRCISRYQSLTGRWMEKHSGIHG